MQNFYNNNFDFENHDLVSAFDELCIWSAPFGLKMLGLIEMKENLNYLDVGFGTGFPLLELAQRFGATCKAYGIDTWTAAHERTLLKIKQYGLTNVNLVNGTAENMPFDNNSFHLITSNNGINNVDDEFKAYNECYRVCKPGGQFVISFNLPETFIEFYTVFEEVLKEFDSIEALKRLKDHIHKKRKTINETKVTLQEIGFKITETISDQFEWRYANGSAMLNHWFIRLAFMDSWAKIPDKSKLPAIFNELENKLNEHSSKNGNFKMSVPFAVLNCRK